MYQTIAHACVLIIALFASAVLPDASVVQSGSPTFPLQVDKVKLTVHRGAEKKTDSLTLPLPVSLYAELRDNIDTIFTYADALRNRRQELSGCRGKAGGALSSCLTFEYMGLTVMRVFFSCSGYKSGRLAAAVDRYPFVVVLSKGFSVRMKNLTKTGTKWSPAVIP
jgi:hypothetical protein